jgi:hypothetical protein
MCYIATQSLLLFVYLSHSAMLLIAAAAAAILDKIN